MSNCDSILSSIVGIEYEPHISTVLSFGYSEQKFSYPPFSERKQLLLPVHFSHIWWAPRQAIHRSFSSLIPWPCVWLCMVHEVCTDRTPFDVITIQCFVTIMESKRLSTYGFKLHKPALWFFLKGCKCFYNMHCHPAVVYHSIGIYVFHVLTFLCRCLWEFHTSFAL